MIKYETPIAETQKFNTCDIITASPQGEWVGDVVGDGDDKVIDDGPGLLNVFSELFGE